MHEPPPPGRRKLTLPIRGVRADLVLQISFARKEYTRGVRCRSIVVASKQVIDAGND